MKSLEAKRIVVVGGSRGVGLQIAELAMSAGAQVLAVARDQTELDRLKIVSPDLATLACDASNDAAPAAIFALGKPDAIVVAAGAIPPTSALQELKWEEFSRNWNVDVKASFLLCKAALTQPLKPGSHIVLLSSGAAIGGSPISGGYSAAKRMQMFMAGFCQQQSDRLELDLTFTAVAPARIMPETRLGKAAVDGYTRHLGITRQAFIDGMPDKQSAADVATAVIDTMLGKYASMGPSLIVSGKGVEAVP